MSVTALLSERLSALTLACRAEGGIEPVMRSRSLGAVALALVELWHRNSAWQVLLDEGRPGVTKTGGQVAWMRRWMSHWDSVFNGSGRQRGKSHFHLACVDWTLREWPGSTGRWCGLTKETAKGIVSQAHADYFITCPRDLRPEWVGDQLIYPNGDFIFVGGTDAMSFRVLRGMARIAIDVRDEYGFYQRPLEIDDALDAGLLVPGPSGRPGRRLYSTTPSDSPGHESNAVAEAHLANGRYEHETLYDNPRADPEAVIRDLMKKRNQTREEVLESTSFRREYLGERVVEERRAAVPRWAKKQGPVKTKHELVVELPTPEHVDFYVSLDPGKTNDPHAGLIAWWSFEQQLLYFTHELEMPSAMNTAREVGIELKRLEGDAFGADAWNGTLLGAEEWQQMFRELPEYLRRAVSKDAPRQPYLRVGDPSDETMLKELMNVGIAMLPSQVHDKHLAVDDFNDMVGLGRVKVHPRCKRLREQLATGIWNEKRTEWERTEKDHCDLLDCAIYINRNVNRHRDCRPKHFDSAQKHILAVQGRAQGATTWEDAFRRKR